VYCTSFEDALEQETMMALTKGSFQGTAFFRALPRLPSLQVVELPYFKCDEWALKQFAEHAPQLR
jgi:hypothetical protein